MIIVKHISLLTILFTLLSGCSGDKKQHFTNLSSFDKKAPAELLSDPVIGEVFRQLVPREQMGCLKDNFDSMWDLDKNLDGSIGITLNGSHAEGWHYATMLLTPEGEINLIISCVKAAYDKNRKPYDQPKSDYLYFTNRDLNKTVPKVIQIWLSTEAANEVGEITMTNGHKKMKISPEELTNRTSANVAKSLSDQSSRPSKLTDISCKFQNSLIKYGFYDNPIPESVKDLKESNVCDAIEETYKKMVISGDESAENMCKVADGVASDKGGYDEAVNWINRITVQGDPLRNLVNNCAPNRRDDFKKRAVRDMHFNIYSAGTIKHWFRECPAVLIETAMTSGKSRGYYLHGLGSCDSVSTFKSFYKPNHGNELIKNYEYDGALPANFVKGGKEQPFYSEHDTKSPPEPDLSSQQQSTISAPQQSTSRNLNTPSGSFGKRYADSAASLFERSRIPGCQTLAYTVRSLGNSGNPDYIIQKQVDSIIDSAPDACAY
jgi:hypothetical protein